MASSSWSATLRQRVLAFLWAQFDERTPLGAKVLFLATVLYVLSPLDLIPDLLPGVGFLDDLTFLPLGMLAVARMIPAQVWVDAFDAEKRKKWTRRATVVLALVVIFAIVGVSVIVRWAWEFTVG